MKWEDYNLLAIEIHKANEKWWTDPETKQRIERNPEELKALIVSELCEALEGERKDRMDDHLPHRKMAEVEMADTVIRVFDFIGGRGMEFDADLMEEIDKDFPETPENKGEAIMGMVEDVCLESWESLIISIERYCDKHGYDLKAAVAEKREYNRTRADHSHEARLKAGGKKF